MSTRAILARLGLALLLLPVAQGALAAGKCERLVATGHPDQPPYLWRDPQQPKQLIGASADLLKALGKELGVRIDVLHSGSRAAAEDAARSGRVDLLAGSYLSVEALEQFDFIHPAYLEVPVQVWSLADKAPLFTRLDDLARHRGALLGAGDYPPALRSQLEQGQALRPATEPATALQQLRQGRLDFLVIERQAGLALLQRAGAADEVQALRPELGSEPLYLALSHNSACNDPWLRGQLAKKLTEFRAAGLPEQLLQRNLAAWQAQQSQGTP